MPDAGLLPDPTPPLSDEQLTHLRHELPVLTDEQRRELWWWVRQRGVRSYPDQQPEPARVEHASAFVITDYIAACDPVYQHCNWSLCWYFLSQATELTEREQDLLSSRAVLDLALANLRPVPGWFDSTLLARAMGLG